MSALDLIAQRVVRGDALTEDDARAVVEATDLIAVASAADDVRRHVRGTTATFVRVLEVHVDAVPVRVSSPGQVSAGELRIVGTPSSRDAAISAVRAAAAIAGSRPVTGFLLSDLEALAPDAAALERLSRKLREEGLAAVAEVQVDAPGPRVDAVQAARRGGLAVLRATVRAASDDRVTAVLQARQLQRSAGGFRAFAPLPRTTSPATPTTGYDDVRQVALARLMLPDIPSIQVDWQLYGPKLAQVALTMGADDVDGVAAQDSLDLGRRRSALEEITRNIEAAGLQPSERDGLFQIIGSSAFA